MLELLVSLSVLLLAVMMIAGILGVVVDSSRKIVLRSALLRKYEYYRDYLNSCSFDSEEISPGEQSKKEGLFIIRWWVVAVEADLKKIALNVSAKSLHREGTVFKSNLLGR